MTKILLKQEEYVQQKVKWLNKNSVQNILRTKP